MKSRVAFAGVAVFAVTIASSMDRPEGAGQIVARRLETNPLITLRSSASLGDNINGPSIIRVPEWVERPLGRYYMYFAHHSGHHIRLAYADAIGGPWRIHEPGVLPVGKTAFTRPLPDPLRGPGSFYTHVASPEVYVDHANRRFIMWTHGMWTNGERWPNDVKAAQDWAREKRYGQLTQVSESRDGLVFEARPALTRVSYLRVFRQGDWFYGMARSGRLARARDPLAPFEAGGNPFDGGAHAASIRHVALLVRGQTLYVFFTAIGDAPERVLVSTVDLTRDWTEWRATPAVEVLRPERSYECADLPLVPSRAGELSKRANEIRDPAILEEGGRTYLFYSLCGEQGIAAAELTFSDTR